MQILYVLLVLNTATDQPIRTEVTERSCHDRMGELQGQGFAVECQAVATEMTLPEVSYRLQKSGLGGFDIRWRLAWMTADDVPPVVPRGVLFDTAPACRFAAQHVVEPPPGRPGCIPDLR